MASRLHSKENCGIEQLPDEILLHILSFLNVHDLARTSIISRRWRNLWHYNTCLDFDGNAFLSEHNSRKSCAWYVAWVNKVLEDRATLHGLPSVKDFQIRYKLDASQSCHIDQWINFAVANRIETLHLECCSDFELVPLRDQYKLSEEFWLKVPNGNFSLNCLKSLFLKNVNVSKHFIEFILSNCPLLEDLSLDNYEAYSDMNVGRYLHKLFEDWLKVPKGLVSLNCLKSLSLKNVNVSKHFIEYILSNCPLLEDLSFDNSGAYSDWKVARVQYKLSEEYWLKVPNGLVSLNCLKSLFLKNVNVSKQFIEFILSNCPLLEDLLLDNSGAFSDLNVGGPPRLRRLKIESDEDFVLNTLCAPHLTSFYCKSCFFNPKKVDVPMLNDLAIGGYCCWQPITNYLAYFRSYFTQLEKLHLIMEEDKGFRLNPIPELVKLKFLMISVDWDTNPFIYHIIYFIKTCPLLETFALQIIESDVIRRPRLPGGKQMWYRMQLCCCFNNLKVFKFHGADGKTMNQKIVKFIINRSPQLEKLIVEIWFPLKSFEPETVEVVEKKVKKLCQGRSFEVKVTLAYRPY